MFQGETGLIMLRALGTLSVLGFLLACGGGDATGPAALNVAGVWNFSETLHDPVHGVTCNDQGTLDIGQSGSTFTGSFSQTGTCTGPGGPVDNSGSGSISGGQISGNNVSFRSSPCQYQGTLSGQPPNRITGSASCSSQPFNFTGNWQAARFRLAVVGQPTRAEVNAVMTPPLRVEIRDDRGNPVVGVTDAVSVALETDPRGGSTLSGTTTVNAVDGVATFADLSINHGGTGFTLRVSAAGLNTVTTNPFDVVFTIVSLTTGGIHSCGVQVTGNAYCWGTIDLGLGRRTTWGGTPVVVSGGLGFLGIDAGRSHTCAVTGIGTTYCWGPNEFGQLGDENAGKVSSTPVLVHGGVNFVSVSAGGDHACGLTTTGTAYCWGFNGTGQLGDTTTVNCPGTFTGTWPCSPTPLRVEGSLVFRNVSAGESHTCGVTTGNVGYCWGNNIDFQLGGSTTERCAATGGGLCSTTPIPVAGGLSFTQISAGLWHSCGITTGGQVYCWGRNGFGQLGNANAGTDSPSPVPVASGVSFTSVTTGLWHTCALAVSGAAYCWGDSRAGQLGVEPAIGTCPGGYQCSQTPVAVQGGLTFVALQAGGNNTTAAHTCGVTLSGAAYCWGANGEGQLGAGNPGTQSAAPVRVTPP
jgi:alpha-tubulin suppressor-like RCC1 family protein